MKKDILICDDAAFMRMMIKDIVKREGYTVAGEAENGRVAIEKYKSLHPSLVLLDSVMPVMDGLEAMQGILEIDPLANIVMCFGIGEKATALKAIRLGAKGSLMKPFQADRVIEAVKEILGDPA
ncbi:response regulator [Bianquea renquensis]|uniref:Stage 0 sporulation protein A homolog n=1 Tax=Bianquea renquensis TaxID=2763661 RepID=A0A926DUZ1_9FIRM|nr:response regulator [Bianquea renquensis]MBC8544571.1 response regulator [Bianquea renquensis]